MIRRRICKFCSTAAREALKAVEAAALKAEEAGSFEARVVVLAKVTATNRAPSAQPMADLAA